ncbi:hypothetical protein GCM10022215_17760 [Nocardioides fonticola]|uniref:Uncharacterized protein n=1 Tax=Nocardioides fonticola TaxID=450363 RepID=A0ABP7XK75_9ACTN
MIACAKCGATAEPVDRGPGRCTLPRPWEHYSSDALVSRPTPHECGAVWCSDCVGALLADLVEAMRVTGAVAAVGGAR